MESTLANSFVIRHSGKGERIAYWTVTARRSSRTWRLATDREAWGWALATGVLRALSYCMWRYHQALHRS